MEEMYTRADRITVMMMVRLCPPKLADSVKSGI